MPPEPPQGVMMMRLRTAGLLLFLCLLLPGMFRAFAADPDLEKEFRREIALYRIRPDSSRSLRKDPDGLAVPEERFKDIVANFYDMLYPVPPSFLKRFKFKSVIFKDTVYDRDGDMYQHRVDGDDLFLDADLKEEQFYTSLFYLQLRLMSRTNTVKWSKLNPDAFSYENSRGNVTGRAKQKLDEVIADWDQYFVSRASMYSPEMDMAQFFTFLMLRGPGSAALTGDDHPVLKTKAEMMIDILTSTKAVESGYMETILAPDLAKLRKYSPEALSVRLYYEYSGRWKVPPYKDESGGIVTPSARRMTDDVEVAGSMVNPLVLALTVNDMKLFRFLAEHKVDPNVSSASGVSALVLAIRNNDPEQVKALLENGATVSPEAARAGTASGVNAEIVKLMTPYLPGVKQLDDPVAKPKSKTAASGERRP